MDELREAQYKLLVAIKEQAEKNKADDNFKKYGNREVVTFEQLEQICVDIPDLNPGAPYKINNDWARNYRFSHFDGGFAYSAKINDLIEYYPPFCFAISQKGLSLMEKYRKQKEEVELRKREVEAAEKTSNATEKVAFEIKNTNMVQKDLLRDINSSLIGINSCEVLEQNSLNKIAVDISNLTLIAKYNFKNQIELGMLKEKAAAKVRRNTKIYFSIIILVAIVGIVLGLIVYFNSQDSEKKKYWDIAIALIPIIVEVVLSFLKSIIVKNEDYYMKKYSKKEH